MKRKDFHEKQLQILHLLLEKPYLQKDLQTKLNISSPGLLYHLKILENEKFIQKREVDKFGNAKINEVRIDPIQMQNIRRMFGLKSKKWTLITGFGELGTGYRIPDEAFKLLQNKEYRLDEVACITTKNGKSIRDEKVQEENLIQIDRYYADFEYNDFRNLKSDFFLNIDEILRKELQNSNVVLDITPLSKLYSFEMLKRANKYKLACYYLGKNDDGQDSIIWMTDVKIEGDYKDKK